MKWKWLTWCASLMHAHVYVFVFLLLLILRVDDLHSYLSFYHHYSLQTLSTRCKRWAVQISRCYNHSLYKPQKMPNGLTRQAFPHCLMCLHFIVLFAHLRLPHLFYIKHAAKFLRHNDGDASHSTFVNPLCREH